MNINEITLPASVVTELYRSSLVIPDELPANKPPDIKKSTLIFYYKTDKQKGFLTDLLLACNLDADKVEFKELETGEQFDYKTELEQSNYKVVLLFGVDPSSVRLPLSFPHFQVQSFAGRTFLFTPPLAEMKDDKLLKSRLWVCLKRMFNV
jgi:hypothetical protein